MELVSIIETDLVIPLSTVPSCRNSHLQQQQLPQAIQVQLGIPAPFINSDPFFNNYTENRLLILNALSCTTKCRKDLNIPEQQFRLPVALFDLRLRGVCAAVELEILKHARRSVL